MTLPYQKLKEMIAGDSPMITSVTEIKEEQIQPCSLDLTIGTHAYRVSSSFLPQPHETIEEVLERNTLYSFDIKPGTILEKNATYIIPLQEGLSLPEEIYGKVNPKSSIGRVDVFVRLLADRTPQFDFVPRGYKGQLYIEVIPLSFVVAIEPGLSLNQAIFRTSDSNQLSSLDLKLAHSKYGLVFDSARNEPMAAEDIRVQQGCLVLTIDLKETDIIGWRSKPSNVVIDLARREYLDADDCWEPIMRTNKNELVIDPNSFYLLASRERVRIPPEYEAEVIAYDVDSGELRSHYAGFFDPGFGHGDDGSLMGSTAVLEVRPHTVPFRLTHGQVICKMVYRKMSEIPEKLYSQSSGSYYTGTGPKLSKHFKNTW
ncbi:MAG: 2'-deoxycytidine 5'-triphosphate deaminase [Candidatus Jacksonbacteria bacterium]|nr:2'-deoxycytidine 5'-triphosphate deaminase [Candidatus Jacksonbacteria bacterium]MBT6034382.1 2'-deoxycytidine 5'-triphosphate deaminase [Candidatus Jacksonbacteria bacterium]MBT6301412.1 2'-deoxycytidine 5'-triphosphate deaminase [Candidatus Jacksonbacteria bacterium]MBT6756803.1 2'-deoxycytidine 5'-triphosphate deaminase [Candidatus Jacksonbacteria bacterium]MBT6954726.1 2'-deoxycytidine 5'-triphosphate deaminase [Candidatus Jacksonbacteria bacterium]